MENLNVYRILVRKTEKRSFGRHGRRFNNSIKIYLKGIGWEGEGWIRVAQDKDK